MRKPCTDCPHNKKIRFRSASDGRRVTWQDCMLTGKSLGYDEMIANCVDYAEYLAWFWVYRRKRQEERRKRWTK